MSEIGSGNGTSYPSAIDTDNTIEVNSPNAGKTKARAEVPNDLAACIIAIETELGTDPAGSLVDVKSFLQVEHGVNGTHDPTKVAMLAGTQTFTGQKTFSSVMHLSKGADIGSATTLPLGTDGNYFDVTGTTTIQAISSSGVGTQVRLHFDSALTIEHNATDLVLPQGEDIKVSPGDELIFIEHASGDWRMVGGSARLKGAIVQTQYVQDGTLASGTGTIPIDNSIPQNTEGNEFMTLAITPKNANNKLAVEVGWNGATISGAAATVALFQDAIANSLAANTASRSAATTSLYFQSSFTYEMTAGTTNTITFKVRAGAVSATTTYFNGNSAGTQMYGGVAQSYIRITEIKG